MKVLIAGSTGMIGNLILSDCVKSDKLDEVVTLKRKNSPEYDNQKVTQVEVTDFADYSMPASCFYDVDIAFFCIGVYTGQVSDKKFKTITVDYAVAFAKALQRESPSACLCLLSGAGADRTEKSRTSFARYKGMAENRIAELGLKFYSFRPGYIYPVVPRKEPNHLYRMSRFIYPIIKLFGNNSSIKSTELAEAMFKVGMSGANTEILENRDIINQL